MKKTKLKHGGNIYKTAKKLLCKPEEIIDFSSNINSYHPNIKLSVTNKMLVRYADSSYSTLKKSIATKYKLERSHIALYNGATSAIVALFESLKNKDVYLYSPLYSEYEKAALDTKKKITKIDRFSNKELKPKRNSIVVFVNPSTPDGKYYKLKKLFKFWKKKNCTVILDESFIEFEELKSLRNQIKIYNKLYIVQSFTKFHACAGVRVGALFSSKKNIQKLTQPLWNLSSFDVEFLKSRINDKKFNLKSKKLHKKHKQELFTILQQCKYIEKVYISDANFFLVKSNHAKRLHKHLLKSKILLRRCESFDFLDNSYMRFAVKDKNAHRLLKQALGTFIE